MTIYVSGLVMLFKHALPEKTSVFAGPALIAAAGASFLGGGAKIISVASSDVSSDERKLVRRLGIDTEYLAQIDQPSLVLDVDALRTGRRDVLCGNALLFTPTARPEFDKNDVLIAANGDPKWLADTLRRSKLHFVAMDLHESWIRSRRRDLLECLSNVDAVFGTEYELDLLEQTAAVSLSSLARVIVKKRGRHGIEIRMGQRSLLLPAPHCGAVVDDTGAGDLLIGCMVSVLTSKGGGKYDLSNFASAYEHAKPLVASFLAAGSLHMFFSSLIARKIDSGTMRASRLSA